MPLVFWTTADVPLIKKTFGASLKSFRPEVPEHRFEVFASGDDRIVPGPGEVVLVCGNKPLDKLKAEGILPKNRTLSSLRERPISAGAGHYLVTFDPAIINSEPEKREVLDWDVRLAERLMSTGSTEPELGELHWVTDLQPVIDFIEKRFAKTGKPVPVATDTETMGFYPWYPDKDIVSISFTAQHGTAHAIYLGQKFAPPVPFQPGVDLFEQIKWLLTTPKVTNRLSNGKYDMIWIAEKWGIECTNFKFDNMLVGSLLDENRSNSLNLHAKVFTKWGGYDDSFNQTQDKGRMEDIPPEKLLPYAGMDTVAAQDVADVLKDELLEDEQLTNFYIKILHPAARAFEKMERRGVVVDQEKMAVLADDLRKIIATSQARQLELLPNRLRIKYRDRIEDQIKAGKNPLLPSLMKEFFFTPNGLNLKPREVTEKTQEPSMAKSHLRQFGDVPEAKAMVEAMTEGDTASKTLSTFVEGFLKHLRPDGRLHPTYFLAHGDYEGYDDDAGTVSGRLSAKDPAIQIVPKKTFWAKRIRECYPAPPGKVVMNFDFSQGELKVVACVANEKTMLAAYEQGLDLHAVTGAKLSGTELQEFLSWQTSEDKALADLYDLYRGNAKPANFGLLYGMMEEGFAAYAWANYGKKFSLAEATAMRNAFFELYPGLLDYHEKQREMVKWKQMVRTPLGRIRHLPTIASWDRKIRSKAERQAINSPIQGALTDMMIWAISLLEDAYPNSGLELVAMIHDAVVAYVPEHEVDLWAGRVTEVMSNLPFHEVGWQPQLKFTADAEAGPTLAALKKVKVLA